MFNRQQTNYELLSAELYRMNHAAMIPKYKRVRFRKRSFLCRENITCAGKAEFYGCTFLYNSPEENVCITVAPSGEVVFKKCTFKRMRSDAGLFIGGNKGYRAVFIDCSFDDCNTFARLDNFSKIVFTGCKFLNCTSAVLEASLQPETQLTFNNIAWYVTASPKHCSPGAFAFSGENRLILFENCRYVQRTTIDHLYSIITAPPRSACFLNSEFDGITCATHTLAAIGCTFRYCEEVLFTDDMQVAMYPALVEDCRFIQCRGCIRAGADTEILRNIFTSCEGTLIRSASKLGHVHIADCTFFECLVNAPKSACVELDRNGSYMAGKINKMENCTFENCHAESGSIIGFQNEITPGYVAIIANCQFNGCDTGANGELIGYKVPTRNICGTVQSRQIYTFYRGREKFIVTDCHADNEQLPDNTPKTQYDTYNTTQCAARRARLKEKIRAKSIRK